MLRRALGRCPQEHVGEPDELDQFAQRRIDIDQQLTSPSAAA
ncbi:MAG: hypothetical protein VKO65_03555 [Cyanobacteriota bacterium]|nr:hypothetical protein [Cyanobacteriota bacterium]